MILGEISNLTQISTGNELLNEALRWVAEHHKDAFEIGILSDKYVNISHLLKYL